MVRPSTPLPKKASITGGQLQQQIIDLAHLFGWKVAHFRPARLADGRWRTPVSADGKGFPDLVLVRERLMVVECKGEHECTSPAQRNWAEWLTAAGAEYYRWRPSDWPDIETTLRERRG